MNVPLPAEVLIAPLKVELALLEPKLTVVLLESVPPPESAPADSVQLLTVNVDPLFS